MKCLVDFVAHRITIIWYYKIFHIILISLLLFFFDILIVIKESGVLNPRCHEYTKKWQPIVPQGSGQLITLLSYWVVYLSFAMEFFALIWLVLWLNCSGLFGCVKSLLDCWGKFTKSFLVKYINFFLIYFYEKIIFIIFLDLFFNCKT